ncbi:uncharacterized protein LOC135345049 isoform X2 [Halichondria panicea]|uniref:uncharacterized protein LOC135345049 isoform X2 n=1 Tax=Halichondria panicea TaxID=6063 RepID=UPI00312B98D5
MLLFNAIMILLLSGHYFAQDETSITHNHCPRMGFTLWSNLTLTCSRICSQQAESDRDLDLWYILPGENLLRQLDLPNNFTYIIGGNQQKINEFENDTGVSLSLTNNNTEDSCNAGEVIQYSLTIENARSSIDGLVVACGARKIENGKTTDRRTSNSTVLYLKSQITTYTTSKITVFPGSSTTVSCTRQLYPDREDSIRNRLRLQLQGEIFKIEENLDKIVAFLGITLEWNTSPNTCTYKGFVNYTLTIGNINQNVDGMLITCGARTVIGTANHDEWYADHSVELVLPTSLFRPSYTVPRVTRLTRVYCTHINP